jgi:hypothetical protein
LLKGYRLKHVKVMLDFRTADGGENQKELKREAAHGVGWVTLRAQLRDWPINMCTPALTGLGPAAS